MLKEKSPFEALVGHAPSLDHIRVFGFLGYVTDVRKSDKFALRAVSTIFLGYSVTRKGYKIYDIHSKDFTVSRDIVLKKDVFSFKYAHKTTSSIFHVLDISPKLLSSSVDKSPSHPTSTTDASTVDEAPHNNIGSEL